MSRTTPMTLVKPVKGIVNRALSALMGFYQNRLRKGGTGHDLDPNRRHLRSIT